VGLGLMESLSDARRERKMWAIDYKFKSGERVRLKDGLREAVIVSQETNFNGPEWLEDVSAAYIVSFPTGEQKRVTEDEIDELA